MRWPVASPLRRPTLIALAFALCGLIPWGLFARDLVGTRDWVSGDFVAFLAAGRLVATGAGSQLYQLGTVGTTEYALAGHAVGGTGILPYFNPPFFAWLLRPLAGLSLQDAYRAWSGFSLLWLVFDAWLLWKIAEPLPRDWRWVVVVAFLTLFPVTFGLRQGQISLILEASWSGAFLLLRSRHPGWAGIALSPMLIKPELLLAVGLLLLWKREWRALSTLGACAVAATCTSVATVGLRSAKAYPDYLLDSTTWSNNGNNPALMFGWNGLLAASVPVRSALRQTAAGGLGLLSLGLALYTWRHSSIGAGRLFGERWLALSLATMLIDQHFYFQDTVLLAPGIVAALAHGRPGERPWLVAGVGVAWGLQLLATYPNETWHVDLLAVLAVVALVGLAAHRYWRVRRLSERRPVLVEEASAAS